MPKITKIPKTNTFYPRKLNPKKTSKEVFNLDDEYLSIINRISNKGPLKESQIIKYVNENCTKNTAPISREIIRKRIYGSTQTTGLLKHEFLFKHKNKFHLSVKGMLASLATGKNIKKFELFLKYIEFASKFIEDQKIIKLLENYIINDIYFFLSWHYIVGIALKKTIAFPIYQKNFLLNQVITENFIHFSKESLYEYEISDYQRLHHKYLEIHYLVGNMINMKILPPANTILDNIFWDNTSGKKVGKVVEKMTVTKLIVAWPIFMNELVRVNYDYSKIQFSINKYRDYFQKNQLERIKKDSIREAINLGFKLEDMGKWGIEIMRDNIAEKLKLGHYSKS